MSDARLVACREKAFGILAVVFVAGLTSGILGTRAYDRHAGPLASTPHQEESAVAMDRLSKDLELNEEQAQKVQTIIDEYIMMEADLLSQVRALQQQGRQEIMQVLEPEQRTKFETMLHTVSTAP